MRGIPIFCKLNPHFHPRCASPEIMFQEAVRIVCNNAAPSAKTMGLHQILKKKKKNFPHGSEEFPAAPSSGYLSPADNHRPAISHYSVCHVRMQLSVLLDSVR